MHAASSGPELTLRQENRRGGGGEVKSHKQTLRPLSVSLLVPRAVAVCRPVAHIIKAISTSPRSSCLVAGQSFTVGSGLWLGKLLPSAMRAPPAFRPACLFD